jgi:hypothetical protein
MTWFKFVTVNIPTNVILVPYSEVDVVSTEDVVDVLDCWHLAALQLGELQIIVDVDFKCARLQQ